MALDIVAIFLRISMVSICLSFLWKSDNPLYSFAEHFFIGAMAGNTILPILQTIWDQGFIALIQGNLLTIFPIILGFMVFGRFTKYRFLSRYPVSLLTGIGIGLVFVGIPKSQILKQMELTINAVTLADTPASLFNGIIITIGVLATLSYFTYTREHTGPLGISSKIGRLFIMVCLGMGWAGHLAGDSVTVVQMFLTSIGELLKYLGLR